MLLNKIKINQTTLRNRIVISPMCQYSSQNGNPSQWHYKHLLNLSSSGAGMLILESTAIEKHGKISVADLCLYNNSHQKKLKKLVNFIKGKNDIKLGIQISHSGRKGSAYIPWVKPNYPLPKKLSWKTFAPSPIPRTKNWPIPKEMSIKQIKNLIKKFKIAGIRANKIGFDCIEIHMAHGYLLHQFFSPVSNKRNDMYGGNIQNRSRLLIEVAKAVREIWPSKKIIGARITGTDHLKNGLSVKDAIFLAKKLKKVGLDYISVSSGGILPKTNMTQKQAFRSEISHKIKKESKLITTTSGMITKHEIAENLIKSRKIDFITIARTIIKDPSWIYRLVKNKKENGIIPKQYHRIFDKY